MALGGGEASKHAWGRSDKSAFRFRGQNLAKCTIGFASGALFEGSGHLKRGLSPPKKLQMSFPRPSDRAFRQVLSTFSKTTCRTTPDPPLNELVTRVFRCGGRILTESGGVRGVVGHGQGLGFGRGPLPCERFLILDSKLNDMHHRGGARSSFQSLRQGAVGLGMFWGAEKPRSVICRCLPVSFDCVFENGLDCRLGWCLDNGAGRVWGPGLSTAALFCGRFCGLRRQLGDCMGWRARGRTTRLADPRDRAASSHVGAPCFVFGLCLAALFAAAEPFALIFCASRKGSSWKLDPVFLLRCPSLRSFDLRFYRMKFVGL